MTDRLAELTKNSVLVHDEVCKANHFSLSEQLAVKKVAQYLTEMNVPPFLQMRDKGF